MWTSGDPLGAVPLVTGILTPLIPLLLLLCIVQQPLRAVFCFSSPSIYINQEAICHQHSGSVRVNKRQEPKSQQGKLKWPNNVLATVESRLFLVVSVSMCIVFLRGCLYLFMCQGKYVGWKNEAGFSFLFKHHHWLCQMACDASSFQSCHWLISQFECIHILATVVM